MERENRRLEAKLRLAQATVDRLTEAQVSLIEAGALPPFRAKSVLRSDALKRRDAIDGDTRAKLAQRLSEHGRVLIAQHIEPDAKLITALFSPIGSEPDVMPLSRALDAAGIPLALPVDWSHGTPLIFRRWSPGDRLAPGPLGITEPLNGADEVEPEVWFIPLLAFDRQGRRIGYGAGNVDRTLRLLRNRKPVLAIGVSFSVLEEPLIPVEAHDEPINLILTERETIVLARPAAL